MQQRIDAALPPQIFTIYKNNNISSLALFITQNKLKNESYLFKELNNTLHYCKDLAELKNRPNKHDKRQKHLVHDSC